MKLTELRATFGRLEDRTLSLGPGLNVISGDNETGKSTWTAFITAMLYGVDTKSRSRGGQLPVKIKYAPWSGKPMEGTAELVWQGRRLRLERRSESGPMAELRVTDVDTGCPVEELSGPDCGRLLLGVEAGVYERSGMIRQNGPAVSADPNLERRLNGLVTAVSEDYACADIDAGLKRLQNAVSYNQTGALPRLEAERSAVRDALSRLETLQQEQNRLTAQLRRAEQEQVSLRRIDQALTALEQEDLRAEIGAAEDALAAAQRDAARWQADCGKLPPEAVLDDLRRQLDGIRDQTRTLAMEDEMDPILEPEAPKDPHFAGMDAEQAEAKAMQDAELVRTGLEARAPRFGSVLLRLLPGLLCLAASWPLRALLDGKTGRIAFFTALAAGGAALLTGLLSLLISGLRTGKKHRAAVAVLESYNADSAPQIERQAAGYRKAAERYAAAKALAAEKKQERADRTLTLEADRKALLDRISALDPGCGDLGSAEAYLDETARARSALAMAERTVLRCQAELDSLNRRVREQPKTDLDPEQYRNYDHSLIRDRITRSHEAVIGLRSERDKLQGAMDQLGDPLALQARVQALDGRLDRLRRRYDALTLARKVLEQADAEVRARFAPTLCQRTGELFSELTEGRYDRVSLDRTMHVTVHPSGASVDRPLSVLSGGTADQLYLALRLAICELLLPDAPIILDDALVYFDDNRAKIALRMLRRMSRDRQILLFTCQGRERRILRELSQAEQETP